MRYFLKVVFLDDKIDVYGINRKYINYKARIENDSTIIPKNRELILKYLRDSELGKTILKGQKKKIGNARNLRVISILRNMDNLWFRKPFDEVTVYDMEEFVLALENGKIKSKTEKPYSSESQKTIKKFIRKFWKWMKGNNRRYPEHVEWIDTSGKDAEIHPLPNLREDVDKMVDFAPGYMKKAILYTLFDSGARKSEFLNFRIFDMKKDAESKMYFGHIRHSKTFARPVALPLATPYIEKWLEHHPEKDNDKAQLFPVSKDSLDNMLKRIGRKALNFNVTCLTLRHTSATYYAQKIPDRATYCKRFGWSFASKMPDRYISWANIYEKRTVEAIEVDEISKFKNENRTLKEELNILKNEVTRLSQFRNSRNKIDGFMTKLLNDPEILKTLSEKVREMNLKEELASL